jgi:hypothetical protein
MASQEGIGRTDTCMCQRANGPAVCVDVKLLGTIEGLSQNSAILVLLHKYGRFFGCIYHGHMISWHKHSDICDVWLCEGVIYHTPGEIPSLMIHLFLPIRLPYFHFRTVIDTICAHL